MSKTYNVAMIGLGFGAEFIPIYQAHPHANVAAICRRNDAELQKSGDQFGIEKRYTKYEDVLADPEIDYVHINSPINDHAWMSLKALDAGKHVMCTVPMATTIEECQQIVEKVKQTGLKYMMAETVVYSREFLFIKEHVREGRIGKNPAPCRLPSAGHGRLARILAKDDPDALRHARRQSLPRPGQRPGRIRQLFWIRDRSRGHRRKIGKQIRGRILPHQNQGFATWSPTSGDSSTTWPVNIGKASTFTVRKKVSSGR